ncbi:NADH-quinone oxidoreductase subunit K [Helicobacter monodelphidis]|uniref:NADH-quinone oxidoreductase subunit NuoK n=1 Tax=Helicobacter sp. 15-1451 TaxID=2004995 RepID=UPI000DCF2989|nr:NADH-quinone oxidoreductase subunit NuoK [Helicobacter sp. 15-1451]RAX59285.1 NADH-quinone oxidoreductase subunit K [Helicobacter sp. 15-1451]
MITLNHYLILSALIFSVGLIGVIRRKNLVMLFLSTEIMLNAVNVGLVAAARFRGDMAGEMFALFIIAIAASEVAVGLGLLILWYKRSGTLDLDALQKMRG